MRVGLRDGAREAVEQVAVGAVGLLAGAPCTRPMMMSSRHQPARVHHFLRGQAERRAGLDGGAQHVAGGDLRDAVLLPDEVGLGALAGAGRAQTESVACDSSHVILRSVRRDRRAAHHLEDGRARTGIACGSRVAKRDRSRGRVNASATRAHALQSRRSACGRAPGPRACRRPAPAPAG